MRRLVLGILIAACAITAPHAQAPPSPAGRVTGPITLAVDLRETPRKLLHARETLSALVRVWKRPVAVATKAENKPVLLRYDGKEHASTPYKV